MRRMRESILSLHILRWQAKETSLVVVYRIPYSGSSHSEPNARPPRQCRHVRKHRAGPWRWATGGYQRNSPRQHQILPQKHRILLQTMLLDSRNRTARAVVLLKHRHTSWIAVRRTAACLRTHSKVLGQLVMTSGDLVAVNYTSKKTTACRALSILGYEDSCAWGDVL